MRENEPQSDVYHLGERESARKHLQSQMPSVQLGSVVCQLAHQFLASEVLFHSELVQGLEVHTRTVVRPFP